MKNILLIIDMQNGFISNEMTKRALKSIEELAASGIFDGTIAAKYINYPHSPLIRFMKWDGFLTEKEQELAGGIDDLADRIVEKPGYSACNADLSQALRELNDGELPKYIFVAGVDTECCVLDTVTDLFECGIRPVVLASYCGSSGGEKYHKAGILCMHRSIGETNVFAGKINSEKELAAVVADICLEQDQKPEIPISKEEKLVKRLVKHGYHIAFAESCTGGLAAARLINVASASAVINESVVTYANEAKMKYLDVPEAMIARYGVVSEAVAGAMAEGIARAAECEVGVGISGIAGPSGATPGKPVGMVCFGFCVDGKVWTRTKQFGNIGRNAVRRAAVEFVYDELLK